MTKSYYYKCCITLGNMSRVETDLLKKSLEAFLSAFRYVEYNKVTDDTDGCPYYTFHITYNGPNELSRDRFMQSIIAFSLYWGIPYSEVGSG